MKLKDTLIKVMELNGVLLDSIKAGDVTSKEAAVSELKTYASSTYTPASQLAKAVLESNGYGEGYRFTRQVYIYLLEKHNKLREALSVVAALPDESPMGVVGDELPNMLEAYRELQIVTSSINEIGNRGDLMVVDVVLTSLGMADTQEEE